MYVCMYDSRCSKFGCDWLVMLVPVVADVCSLTRTQNTCSVVKLVKQYTCSVVKH